MAKENKEQAILNVLVTGANGQLGLSFQKIAHEWPRFHFIFCSRDDLDITDKSAISEMISASNIEVVINCAAYTAVDLAETEKENAFKINRDAVASIAELCHEKNILLVHYSSDYVYNTVSNKKLQESSITTPEGIYAESKLAGEQAIQKICNRSLIIRTSWVYSEFGKNFIKTMLYLGEKGIDLKVISDQVGAPTYAGDIATESLEMISQLSSNEVALDENLIVNYAGEGSTNWYEMANFIFEYSGMTVNISETTTEAYGAAAPRPLWSVLDMTKIKSIFGIAPLYWKERVGDCIDILTNQNLK